MLNTIHKILSKKLWAGQSGIEQKRLFQLLIIWVVLAICAILLLSFSLSINSDNSYIISDIALILMVSLGILCTLNGKTNCTINSVFTVPVFIYTYFISDFNTHLPGVNTIYSSVALLFTGLVFLLFFSNSETKIKFYFLLGILTLAFQLLRTNQLYESFTELNSLASNPLLIFIAIYFATYFLRKKYVGIINLLKNQFDFTNQSITKVFQDSNFSIVQINAEHDNEGNIVEMTIGKVNNAFEANFKINLYEVQDQKAEYIFNFIFKNQFSLNEIVHFKRNKSKEFHAKNLERWFKVHLLIPEYNKFYLIFEDITKIKKKFADLEASKRKYKVLLEAIPDIFFVIDKDGTYEDFVVKESHLFKIEDANIIGSTIYDVGFPENMANKIYSCIQDSIKNNSIENIEYSLNTPNGTFMYEMRLAKLNPHSVISVARDITKRKTAEFNLGKALVKAEESDRLKSAFLTNLSHEIRTPMNIITNFSRILTEAELDDNEKLEISDAISQNGKQLLNMIENKIHLSKIETQSVDIKMQVCEINSLLRDIYNRYYTLIPDSKNIKLDLVISVPNQEFGFITDAKLLSEILAILVDNAVKYTMLGNITIDYEMIKNEQIKFIISDTGIGIPKEEFKNIFSRFYRLENKINETTSGSGIGLSIAQHYVALLGGELEFESTINTGTTFTFTLPFKGGTGFLRIVS
ncbi:MAG: PAS domain-containing sensor histidine kinase [Draconibacterium sp.]|nr:PAS domain-containing sensor histidine kinase [Draconibacterium sp.]